MVVIPAHHFQFTVHLTNHFKDTLTQQQTSLWCFQITRDPYLWRTMLTFKIEWYKGMAPVLSITHKEIPIVILPLELMFRKFQISVIIISNHFPSLVYLHLHWHCKENESQHHWRSSQKSILVLCLLLRNLPSYSAVVLKGLLSQTNFENHWLILVFSTAIRSLY